MLYLTPEGHNWGPMNLDGYGISLIAFAALYSIIFYAGCFFLWLNRNHSALRMRKINLALLSVLILHVYLFMVFMVYPLNGVYPCGVEFWTMSIYLPLGIGFFQAQNQQLLIVTQDQTHLIESEGFYKPFIPPARTIGLFKHWTLRFKVWVTTVTRQTKLEGLVFAGICVQLVVSAVLYCLSRKFTTYGIFSHPVSPGLCRRGWEWIPSIVWQFLWIYLFGPCLLWKIRNIRDIYHWRLQTTLAIIAGIPGTPMWLASVYSDNFDSINKYWVPALWFAPGLMVMEIVTIVFPIVQVINHNKAVFETRQALNAFDSKRLASSTSHDGSGSMTTGSTGSKRSGKMYSMESLDECLNTSYDGLQVYASYVELNGENIVFLVRVLAFRKLWAQIFSRPVDLALARGSLFRVALSIYVSLVHSATATYPINIESNIYHRLESIFGTATELVATTKRDSVQSTPNSAVTPWDDPPEPSTPGQESGSDSFAMHPILAAPPMRKSDSNESSELIISSTELGNPADALTGFSIPVSFEKDVFDAAFNSIRYMVWTETWQRYMHWARTKEASG